MTFAKSTKNIAKNLLLFVLSLSIVFVVLELSYRVYKYYKYKGDIKNLDYPLIVPLGPADRLEYVFKPNSQHAFKDGIIYRINSKGLRDREFNYEKPKGAHRILALGDSYTFGWMEKLNDSYPKQLESILSQAPDQKYEVINAGIYGYNTEQEYEFLKREAIKYNPDLVILGFVINDAEPQNVMPRSPYLEMEGLRLWLPELIKYKINILLEQKFNVYDFFTIQRKEHRYHFWESFTKKEFEWKKENCFTALRNIKHLLDRRNIALLVVVFPSLERGSPPYGKYRYKAINDSVRDFCGKEKIEVLDLYPFFEGKKIGSVKQELGHLNRKGYSLAAEAIANIVRATPPKPLSY